MGQVPQFKDLPLGLLPSESEQHEVLLLGSI